MDRPGLLRAMESSYGSTAADGHWSLRDAYDVLELAQVLHLAKLDLPQEPAECLAALTALTASLPTHTVRSEEQIALQQFSTPAAIGYLAALAVRITTADTVLERSEEHTSELQSLMRTSYAAFCLKKQKTHTKQT